MFSIILFGVTNLYPLSVPLIRSFEKSRGLTELARSVTSACRNITTEKKEKISSYGTPEMKNEMNRALGHLVHI